jgi:glucose-1-phosphate cytidylyltransferase
VRDHVKDEEIFCANYSDGLTDVDLGDVLEKFKASGKAACFVATRPPLTYHMADIAPDGEVRDIYSADRANIWINSGYFFLRPKVFEYMNEGEELVVEPFKRLIAENQLMAYKYEGFFRSMDTLRDRQVLEDMFEKGQMPWAGPMAGQKP